MDLHETKQEAKRHHPCQEGRRGSTRRRGPAGGVAQPGGVIGQARVRIPPQPWLQELGAAVWFVASHLTSLCACILQFKSQWGSS